MFIHKYIHTSSYKRHAWNACVHMCHRDRYWPDSPWPWPLHNSVALPIQWQTRPCPGSAGRSLEHQGDRESWCEHLVVVEVVRPCSNMAPLSLCRLTCTQPCLLVICVICQLTCTQSCLLVTCQLTCTQSCLLVSHLSDDLYTVLSAAELQTIVSQVYNRCWDWPLFLDWYLVTSTLFTQVLNSCIVSQHRMRNTVVSYQNQTTLPFFFKSGKKI